VGGLIETGGSVRVGAEQYFKFESVLELVERFGLQIGEPLSGGWTP
jgi:hypothetical protein